MSLRLKLALSGSLLLAMSLGLVTFYTLNILKDHFESRQKARVLELQPLLNAALTVPLLQRDYASVQAILQESLEDPSLHELQAFDSAGRQVAAVQRFSTSQSDAPSGALSNFRANLSMAGQSIGSVSFTLSRYDLDEAQKRITRYILTVGSLALFFFSGLLWILSGSITQRLQRLVEAIQRIRHGYYAPALPAASNDEVGLLVQAFSTMSDEIQRKVDELHTLNDGLERQVEQRTQDLTLRTIELARSVQALETKTYLLNHAPFAIMVLDASTSDFRILDTNNAVMSVFGHDPSTAIGQPVEWLEPSNSQGVLLRQLRVTAKQSHSQEWEAMVRCGSNDVHWTRCLAFPLNQSDTNSSLVALCLVDIHEVWQAREDQRRLEGDLQESNKLQSVSLAIAGIAHDLNTPIGIALTGSTKIRDSLEPLIATPSNGSPWPDEMLIPVEKLRKLHRASELVASNLAKAGSLVKGLKTTTANASRTEWRKFALHRLIESLLVTLSPITRRAGCIVRVTCPTDLNLYSEPGSLGQVLTNLVVNATLHAFEGRTNRELHIEATQLTNAISIQIADNGNGMTSEAIAHVFQPFFTTRRDSGGSGLGLFSARRVVENVLGGSIDMHSVMGEGTTFQIVLPMINNLSGLQQKTVQNDE